MHWVCAKLILVCVCLRVSEPAACWFETDCKSVNVISVSNPTDLNCNSDVNRVLSVFEVVGSFSFFECVYVGRCAARLCEC